jgi:hypothetical protein
MPKRFADPVRLPSVVFEGLEAVQEAEHPNMTDARAVRDVANRIGRPEAARWIDEHVEDYAEGLFRGFVAAE